MNMRLFTLAIMTLCTDFGLAFEIDFSRRQSPATLSPSRVDKEDLVLSWPSDRSPKSVVSDFLPFQKDIVVVHTKDGFVPSLLPLRRNESYKLHFFNLDGANKNISLLIELFKVQKGLFFTDQVTVSVTPTQEGRVRFESPETGHFGEIQVINAETSGNQSPRTLATDSFPIDPRRSN